MSGPSVWCKQSNPISTLPPFWVDPLLVMLCRATQSPLSLQVLREAPSTTSTLVPFTTRWLSTMGSLNTNISSRNDAFFVFLGFFSTPLIWLVDPGQDGWPTPSLNPPPPRSWMSIIGFLLLAIRNTGFTFLFFLAFSQTFLLFLLCSKMQILSAS